MDLLAGLEDPSDVGSLRYTSHAIWYKEDFELDRLILGHSILPDAIAQL